MALVSLWQSLMDAIRIDVVSMTWLLTSCSQVPGFMQGSLTRLV